jgi:hypothetical protein
MSDYISGLRQDLVEAAARQQAAGRGARVARPLRPRAWSPAVALGAAAALVAVALVVAGLRAIGPVSTPADPQIVQTARIGGHPRDAVAVGDSLVVVDYDGSVARLRADDLSRRTPLGVKGTAVSIAATGETLWVVTEDADRRNPPRASLLKLDAGSGRLVARIPLHDAGDAIAAGAIGAWVPAYLSIRAPVPGAPVKGVFAFGSLVVAERSVWTHSGDRVVQLDARGRLLRKVGGISEPLEPGAARTIVPDAAGAWVAGQADGTLYRVGAGGVSRRVKVGRSAGVLARVGSTLWASATVGAGRYVLVRVDARSGKVTGRIQLGQRAPQAIVPVGNQVWVLTSGGEVLYVNPA